MWVFARIFFRGAASVMVRMKKALTTNFAYWFMRKSKNCKRPERNCRQPGPVRCETLSLLDQSALVGGGFSGGGDCGSGACLRPRDLSMSSNFLC